MAKRKLPAALRRQQRCVVRKMKAGMSFRAAAKFCGRQSKRKKKK